jgi:small nuclear ribonucleoprotein (snRNP)-like protein
VNQSSFLCILSSSELYSSFLQTCECVLCGKNGLTAMALQNLIFRFLQSKSRIQFWLFEQKDMRIEGRIIGFDEYMNLVLDEAEEISLKKKTRKPLGDSSFRLQRKFLLYNSDFSLTHMITSLWFLYFLQGGSC